MQLIAGHWYAYVDSGQVATLRRWLRDARRRARSAPTRVAAHCAAWAAALSGDRESVRRWLSVMETGPRDEPLPDGMRSLTSSAALLRSMHGFEGYRVMREAADEAVALEQDPASPWYALARTALGFSLYLAGEPEAAEEPAEQAVFSEAAIPLVRMLSLSTLALAAAELGQTGASRGARPGGPPPRHPHRGQRGTARFPLLHVAAGAVYAARGQLGEARDELEHAVRVRQAVPGVGAWTTVKAMVMLTRVLLDMGDDRAGAAYLIDQARLLLASLPDPRGGPAGPAEQLEPQLAAGDAPRPWRTR